MVFACVHAREFPCALRWRGSFGRVLVALQGVAALCPGSSSLFGSQGAMNTAPPTIGQSFVLAFSIGSVHSSTVSPGIPSSLNRPFVVGPGYSPIPDKQVIKIRSGQFVGTADQLGDNLKALEVEPQTYRDSKLSVILSRKRI